MLRILFEYWNLFSSGFLVSLKLVSSVSLVGFIIGLLLIFLARKYYLFQEILNLLKFFTKVVPVLVLLFWVHYPMQELIGVIIDPFYTAVISLGFVNAISLAYLVNYELLTLPKKYRELGLSLGLSKEQVFWKIELSIITKRVKANILLQQATVFEYSLLASLISVPELFRVAQTVNAMVYSPVEVYSILVLFFIIALVPIHLYINYLNKNKLIYA